MQLDLSQMTVICITSPNLSSWSLSHISSQVVDAMTRYSTSTLDLATRALLLTFLGDNVRSNMWACGSLFEPELTGCERSVHNTLDGGGLTRKFSDNDCGGHTLQKRTHWKRGTQWWQLETKRKSFQKNLYQWRVGPLRNLSYSAVAVQSGT